MESKNPANITSPSEPVTRLITILGTNAPSIKHPIAVLWLNELKSMLLVDAEHHCVHLVNCDTGIREKESIDEFISHLSAQSISRVCEGLNRPSAIARHTNAQRCPDIFIADTGNNRIQALTFNLGGATSVRTLCGGSRRGYKDGTASEAMFSSPSGMVCAPVAPYLFIADTGNHAIRRIHLISGVVETIAGGSCGHRDGRAGHAKFNSPTGLAIDPEGLLYVADTGNHCIRIVHPDGLVQTLAGGGLEGAKAGCADGMRLDALFSLPRDVCIMMRTSMAHPNQKHSVILVADSGNGLIRQINHDGGVETIAGIQSDHLAHPPSSPRSSRSSRTPSPGSDSLPRKLSTPSLNAVPSAMQRIRSSSLISANLALERAKATAFAHVRHSSTDEAHTESSEASRTTGILSPFFNSSSSSAATQLVHSAPQHIQQAMRAKLVQPHCVTPLGTDGMVLICDRTRVILLRTAEQQKSNSCTIS